MVEEFLSNEAIWYVVLVYLAIMVVAGWANVNDPNSETNDLGIILDLE